MMLPSSSSSSVLSTQGLRQLLGLDTLRVSLAKASGPGRKKSLLSDLKPSSSAPCHICNQGNNNKILPFICDDLRPLLLGMMMGSNDQGGLTLCPHCLSVVRKLARLTEEVEDIKGRIRAVITISRNQQEKPFPIEEAELPSVSEEMKEESESMDPPDNGDQFKDQFEGQGPFDIDQTYTKPEDDDEDGGISIDIIEYTNSGVSSCPSYGNQEENKDSRNESPTALLGHIEVEENDVCGGLTQVTMRRSSGRRKESLFLPEGDSIIKTGRKNKKGPFACSKCGKNFKDSWALKRHLRSQTAHLPPRPTITTLQKQKESDFACSKCAKNFKDSWRLKRHLRSKSVHLRPPTTATLQKKKEGGWTCSKCAKKFKDSWGLKRHLRSKTAHLPRVLKKKKRVSQSLPPENWSCGSCAKEFWDCWNLRQHLWTLNHIPSPSSAERMKERSKESYICVVCGRIFYFQYDLKLHGQKVHHLPGAGGRQVKTKEVELAVAEGLSPPSSPVDETQEQDGMPHLSPMALVKVHIWDDDE